MWSIRIAYRMFRGFNSTLFGQIKILQQITENKIIYDYIKVCDILLRLELVF